MNFRILLVSVAILCALGVTCQTAGTPVLSHWVNPQNINKNTFPALFSLTDPSLNISLIGAEIQDGAFNLKLEFAQYGVYLSTMNLFELEWQNNEPDPLPDLELDPLSDIHPIPDGRDFLKAGLIIRLSP
ncbi:MAG: hypothetical protein RIM99_02660 [Cyclobacteriaceae bacterium]